MKAVGNVQPGDTQTLTVYRQGETLDIDVVVEEQTSPALPEDDSADDADDQGAGSGDPLDPEDGQDNGSDGGSRRDQDQDMYDLFDEFMRQFGGRGA